MILDNRSWLLYKRTKTEFYNRTVISVLITLFVQQDKNSVPQQYNDGCTEHVIDTKGKEQNNTEIPD